MIGKMDRKVTLLNPTATKSASGGTMFSFAAWAQVWCSLERGSGNTSEAGSQRNLIKNGTIAIRYSDLVGQFLNKDTKAQINGKTYSVTDFDLDSREAYVSIDVVSVAPGTTTVTSVPPEGVVIIGNAVFSYLKEITVDVAGGTSFTLAGTPDLRNKTIVTIETGRAIPIGIITEGTPTEMEIKYTAATGVFEVAATAPLMEGEKFRVIYR